MGVIVRWVKERRKWGVFVNHRGERWSQLFARKKAAETVAADIEVGLARATLRLPASSTDDVQTYGERWIADAQLKVSTRRFYRDNLKNHIVPALGSQLVSSITREDVKRFLVKLRAKKLQPKTITGVIRTLSTILSEAVEDGLLAVNPALRPGRLRRQMTDPDAPKRAVIDPYTREDAAALVATAAAKFPEWHVFVLTALRTGLRLGELRALEWDDIDWRGRYIRVERNHVEGTTSTPKSGLHRRVDLSDQLRTTLRLYRRQRRAYWLQQGKPRPRLVFTTPSGTTLDDSKTRKAIKAITTAADVRPRRSIVHVFRHTFCSLLAQQGESLVYIKEQAGHSTIQITADLYARFMPGGNRGAVDRLDDAPALRQNHIKLSISSAKGTRNAE